LSAVAEEWRRGLGDDFASFREAFLQKTTRRAESHPCPDGCGCSHEVRPDSLVAVCQCDPPDCEDFAVAEADLVIWELNSLSLARALAQSLGVRAQVEPAGIAGVWEIGCVNGAAVPVFLSVQEAREDFRAGIAELAERIAGPFMMVAPTGTFLNSATRRMLAGGSMFLDLETQVTLNGNGTLSASKRARDQIAALVPKEEEDLSDEALRKAFAQILLAAKAQPGSIEAPIKDVFDLYCMKDLSSRQTAAKLNCSKATIINRLAEIQKLCGGVKPAKLRDHKPFFERMEKDLADPRARRIRRKDAAQGDDPADERD
jgi:hypothetical protein